MRPDLALGGGKDEGRAGATLCGGRILADFDSVDGMLIGCVTIGVAGMAGMSPERREEVGCLICTGPVERVGVGGISGGALGETGSVTFFEEKKPEGLVRPSCEVEVSGGCGARGEGDRWAGGALSACSAAFASSTSDWVEWSAGGLAS
jgi:hypothetical protein